MKISKEFQVGLFMVIAIAILYIGFNYLQGVEFFDDTNKFYTKYQNVGGLNKSNSVSISGLSVGRVSDVFIEQSDSNKVVVEMTINGDILLGKDAKAVLDIGLLGDVAIKVDPGDISNPAQPGDTINAELAAGMLDMVTNAVEPVATTLQSTIQRVNVILDKLTGSGDKINMMVDNLESTTASTKRFAIDMRRDLKIMVDGYTSVINNINGKINELSPVIGKYGELADSLKTIDIQPTLIAAEQTMKNLDSLILKINESDGSLNALIEDKSLYENLNNSMLSLDSLLIHMRSRPKDFFKPLGRDKPKGIRK